MPDSARDVRRANRRYRERPFINWLTDPDRDKPILEALTNTVLPMLMTWLMQQLPTWLDMLTTNPDDKKKD